MLGAVDTGRTSGMITGTGAGLPLLLNMCQRSLTTKLTGLYFDMFLGQLILTMKLCRVNNFKYFDKECFRTNEHTYQISFSMLKNCFTKFL